MGQHLWPSRIFSRKDCRPVLGRVYYYVVGVWKGALTRRLGPDKGSACQRHPRGKFLSYSEVSYERGRGKSTSYRFLKTRTQKTPKPERYLREWATIKCLLRFVQETGRVNPQAHQTPSGDQLMLALVGTTMSSHPSSAPVRDSPTAWNCSMGR